MQDLKITLLQANLAWENIPENLSSFDKKLAALKKNDTDLIILPEMFSTGFSMNASKLAEEMNGHTISWMKAHAAGLNCVITGSLIIKENEKYYNRLIWMQPEGNHSIYDKKHLFTLAQENETYTAGNKKLTVDVKGWKVCPLICYDLRFPVWSRNKENYELLIYVANWPEKRNEAWKTLLKARAIENQCYVAAVNRVGSDGNDHYYSGDSAVIRYDGQALFQAAHNEISASINLDRSGLEEYKRKFAFYKDADDFTIA